MKFSTILSICIFASAALMTPAETIKSEVKMNLEEFQDIFSSARLNEAEQRVVEQKKRHDAEHQRKIKELDEAILRAKARADEGRMADQQALFPENYKVLTQRADGLFNASDVASGVEGDVASFGIELMIRIMSSKWTTIPITNTTSMVASDWEVSWVPREAIDDTETGLVYEVLDPVANPETMFLVKEEQQVLATNRTGLFRVRFTAHSRVRKDRKLNSVSLSSLLHPLASATLRLCSNKIAPADQGLAVKELSINPAAAVLRVQPDDGCAKISMILPLISNKFEIRWLDIVDAAKEKKKSEPGSVDKDADKRQLEESLITVSHDVMHIVEEGVIRSTNVLKFETSESGVNSIKFRVHGTRTTRVTSVSGHGLSRWAAGPYNSTELMIPVQAYFKSSNVGSPATLHVHTESDTDAASKTQELELPRIECMGVLRQSGRIGVIKVANNVELHQTKAVGLARAEPTDISSQLRLNTDRPIMLAYKYLQPNYKLELSATSHASMDTLEAVADRAHYEALVMDTHIMHSLLVMMKSTKLQYLELQGIPPDASMFTLIVNGVQTKPVKGGVGEDSLLVPLLVGLDNSDAANDGLGVKTSIELRYFSTQDDLGDEGSLSLPLPQVTLPTSIVTAELRLPKTHLYNFTGDFGNNGVDRLSYPVPSSFSYVKGKRMVPKGYRFSRLDDVQIEDDTSQDGSAAIQMEIPQSGRSYFFQRLLVVNTPLSINVAYFLPPPKTPPSFWDSLKHGIK